MSLISDSSINTQDFYESKPIGESKSKNGPIKLPQELFNEIFSYLGKNDLQIVVYSSKKLGVKVLEAVKFNEPASIKRFISGLIERLDPKKCQMQRDSLKKIAQNIPFQDFENLLLVKKSILQVKAQLIKTLDEETIEDLKTNVKPSNFMEDIFELVVFEKKIDAANLLSDTYKKEDALKDISKNLVLAGYIDRAIEVAKLIPKKSTRGYALEEISKVLVQAGKFDKAIEAAKLIPEECAGGYTLVEISNVLVQAGKFDKAIEVAMLIANANLRGNAFFNISQGLAQAGDINGLIKIAMLIPDESKKLIVLSCFSEGLTKNGNIDGASKVATLIPAEFKSEFDFNDIFDAFTQVGDSRLLA